MFQPARNGWLWVFRYCQVISLSIFFRFGLLLFYYNVELREVEQRLGERVCHKYCFCAAFSLPYLNCGGAGVRARMSSKTTTEKYRNLCTIQKAVFFSCYLYLNARVLGGGEVKRTRWYIRIFSLCQMYLCLRTFLDFSIFLFLTQSLY